MNKSFKVVFSKARSALMVVNEATSSIQAKGTKTVIAAAAVAMIAGGAMAAQSTEKNDRDRYGHDGCRRHLERSYRCQAGIRDDQGGYGEA